MTLDRPLRNRSEIHGQSGQGSHASRSGERALRGARYAERPVGACLGDLLRCRSGATGGARWKGGEGLDKPPGGKGVTARSLTCTSHFPGVWNPPPPPRSFFPLLRELSPLGATRSLPGRAAHRVPGWGRLLGCARLARKGPRETLMLLPTWAFKCVGPLGAARLGPREACPGGLPRWGRASSARLGPPAWLREARPEGAA